MSSDGLNSADGTQQYHNAKNITARVQLHNSSLSQTADSNNSSQDGYPKYGAAMQDFEYPPLMSAYVVTISILALLGIVANIMGVVSLLKQRMNKKDCTRSRILLLISLSISDSLTCVVVLLKPYLNYTLINSHLAHECTNNLMEILLSSCHIVTLLNLLGMAIDHWITLTKPFRYFVLMSKNRALAMIGCFWAFGLLSALAEYASGLHKIKMLQEKQEAYDSATPGLVSDDDMYYYYDYDYDYEPDNYCALIKDNAYYHPDYVLYILAPCCLIAMIIIYCRIYKEIKQLVITPPPQQDFGQAKRALYTTLVILGTFLICWLPNLTLQIVYQLLRATGTTHNQTMQRAMKWSYVLLLLNSLLDPIIYMSHLRLKLTALCHFIFYKVTNKYDRVHLDEVRRQEIVASHTMTTMRSSVQMSAICSGDGGC